MPPTAADDEYDAACRLIPAMATGMLPLEDDWPPASRRT